MTMTLDELAQRTQPQTVSRFNCYAVIGMSWTWALRFAREHSVPIWRVGERKQLIPVAQLVAAIERVGVDTPALTPDEQLTQMRAMFAENVRRRRAREG